MTGAHATEDVQGLAEGLEDGHDPGDVGVVSADQSDEPSFDSFCWATGDRGVDEPDTHGSKLFGELARSVRQ
ncbi:MAG TPA: hypothetical protein VIW24_32585 [Aldersonia sp.]